MGPKQTRSPIDSRIRHKEEEGARMKQQLINNCQNQAKIEVKNSNKKAAATVADRKHTVTTDSNKQPPSSRLFRQTEQNKVNSKANVILQTVSSDNKTHKQNEPRTTKNNHEAGKKLNNLPLSFASVCNNLIKGTQRSDDIANNEQNEPRPPLMVAACTKGTPTKENNASKSARDGTHDAEQSSSFDDKSFVSIGANLASDNDNKNDVDDVVKAKKLSPSVSNSSQSSEQDSGNYDESSMTDCSLSSSLSSSTSLDTSMDKQLTHQGASIVPSPPSSSSSSHVTTEDTQHTGELRLSGDGSKDADVAVAQQEPVKEANELVTANSGGPLSSSTNYCNRSCSNQFVDINNGSHHYNSIRNQATYNNRSLYNNHNNNNNSKLYYNHQTWRQHHHHHQQHHHHLQQRHRSNQHTVYYQPANMTRHHHQQQQPQHNTAIMQYQHHQFAPISMPIPMPMPLSVSVPMQTPIPMPMAAFAAYHHPPTPASILLTEPIDSQQTLNNTLESSCNHFHYGHSHVNGGPIPANSANILIEQQQHQNGTSADADNNKSSSEQQIISTTSAYSQQQLSQQHLMNQHIYQQHNAAGSIGDIPANSGDNNPVVVAITNQQQAVTATNLHPDTTNNGSTEAKHQQQQQQSQVNGNRQRTNKRQQMTKNEKCTPTDSSMTQKTYDLDCRQKSSSSYHSSKLAKPTHLALLSQQQQQQQQQQYFKHHDGHCYSVPLPTLETAGIAFQPTHYITTNGQHQTYLNQVEHGGHHYFTMAPTIATTAAATTCHHMMAAHHHQHHPTATTIYNNPINTQHYQQIYHHHHHHQSMMPLPINLQQPINSCTQSSCHHLNQSYQLHHPYQQKLQQQNNAINDCDDDSDFIEYTTTDDSMSCLSDESYNLLQLLPVTVMQTRSKQPYGMSAVWQEEFESLFKQFSNAKWLLQEVETKPLMRPTTMRTQARLNYGHYRPLKPHQQQYNIQGINRKFKMFVDSAKVRFCCDNCGHGWTSMKGRVIFWYELFQTLSEDTSDSSDNCDNSSPGCRGEDCGADSDDKTENGDDDDDNDDNGEDEDEATENDVIIKNAKQDENHAFEKKQRDLKCEEVVIEIAVADMEEIEIDVHDDVDNKSIEDTKSKDVDDNWDQIGYCAFKLFGQQCDHCNQANKFERAMWYPEEVGKVLNNFYNKIGQLYYGFKMPAIDKQRRAGKPKTSHNGALCQACHDGVCSDRK